jgi:hypothetical protein
MRFLPALAIAAAVVLGSAAPVHADPEGIDASFVNALDQAGITYNSKDEAVAAGHEVCVLMDNGQSDTDVVKKVTEKNTGFTISGAAKFAAIAMSAYCPDRLSPKGDEAP